MSQVNAQQNGQRYTLEQFQNLANNSQDNQSLRIRTSNHELTTSPLGFLASIFLRKPTNTLVNRAFMQTITTDPRYQCEAQEIHRTLSTAMPETQNLTPAKIKMAVTTADNILKAHNESQALTNKLVASQNLPQHLAGEFRSFYIDYAQKHPDFKLDLSDCGNENLLTDAERQLPGMAKEAAQQRADANRLKPIANLLKAFYTQGDRLERAGLFKFTLADCGNDPDKAKEINLLFAENCTNIPDISTEEGREHAVYRCFDTGNTGRIPKKGDALSAWPDDIHKNFIYFVGSTTHSKTNYFGFCSTDDIKYLREHAPASLDKKNRNSWLDSVSLGLKKAFTIHPEWANPGHEAEISEMVRHLCQSLESSPKKSIQDVAQNAIFENALLLNVKSNSTEALCQNLGIDPAVGRAALKTEQFLRPTLEKAKALKTDVEIAQLFKSEAEKFLESNKNVLVKLEEVAASFAENEHDALISIGMPFANLLEKMGAAQTSEPGLLRQANLVADKFFAQGLTDATRGKILNALIDTFTKDKSVEEKTNFCQTNKERLERLLGELRATGAKQDSTPAVRDSCERASTLLNVLYNQMLNRLPEDQQLPLSLEPKVAQNANPNLANQMEPVHGGAGQVIQPIKRDATSAEIFAAVTQLETENKDQAKILGPLVEKTGCNDVSLLKAIYHSDVSSGISNDLKTIDKTGEYAKNLSHYYADIFNLGGYVTDVVQNFPLYSSDDISNLYADVFLTAHTDEELAKILDGLQSQESMLALNVLYNHAQKEHTALNGRVNRNVDQAFNALKVLDQIQSKIAQKLGREAPESLFTKFTDDKTMRDLPKQEQLDAVIPDHFGTHLNYFDTKMFMSRDPLSNAEYDNVKNFLGQIKLPDGNVVGNGRNKSKFEANYTDNSGQAKTDQWDVNNLTSLFAFNARAVSNLLTETGGNPSPNALWGVLHGGQPPANLTLDNFAEKIMERTTQEYRNYVQVIGQRIPLGINNFMNVCDSAFGISAPKLLEKFSHANQEDITLTRNDQTMTGGIFNVSPSVDAESGRDAYGFGLDFIRTKMPLGAKNVSDEGIKITVVVDGQEKIFTQKAYDQFNAQVEADGGRADHSGQLTNPYIKQIVDTVEPLCQNKAQLAAVGVCTSQNVQMALRNANFVYKDVTGSALEHTSLDHRIEKQEDGTIKVTISEKEGSLFKFNMDVSVDVHGKINVNEANITFPSLPKWNAHMQAHPGDRRYM